MHKMSQTDHRQSFPLLSFLQVLFEINTLSGVNFECMTLASDPPGTHSNCVSPVFPFPVNLTSYRVCYRSLKSSIYKPLSLSF